ncbi:hypothetical protein [Bizionia arctica]|uniref:Lipoprotein n=1 Tax=Bizionia arctica TaxID=1495645 RepID=A0A917GC16_9FLAO|nr:hypothetical protein [Bizionia arctica]GGG36213.1 hypothetical protein GCM10010976_04890 [Bizionia arctica]
MQRINRIIFSLVFSVTLSSCNNSDKKDEQQLSKVISLLVKEFSVPLPPLPKMIEDSLVFEQIAEVIDSLKNIKMTVAIYPVIKNLEVGEKERKVIINNEVLKNIIERSHNKIVLADTVLLKNSKDWKEYDLLYRFTNLEFNSTRDSCKIYFGVSRSALWGQAYVVYLERKKDNWEITETVKKEKW